MAGFWPDSWYRDNLLLLSCHQAINVAKGLGNDLGCLLTQIANIEREEEARKRLLFAGFDGIEHVSSTFLLDAFQRQQLVTRQMIEVCDTVDIARFGELLAHLLAD